MLRLLWETINLFFHSGIQCSLFTIQCATNTVFPVMSFSNVQQNFFHTKMGKKSEISQPWVMIMRVYHCSDLKKHSQKRVWPVEINGLNPSWQFESRCTQSTLLSQLDVLGLSQSNGSINQVRLKEPHCSSFVRRSPLSHLCFFRNGYKTFAT